VGRDSGEDCEVETWEEVRWSGSCDDRCVDIQLNLEYIPCYNTSCPGFQRTPQSIARYTHPTLSKSRRWPLSELHIPSLELLQPRPFPLSLHLPFYALPQRPAFLNQLKFQAI